MFNCTWNKLKLHQSLAFSLTEHQLKIMAGILILTAAFDVQFVECQSKTFCPGGKKIKAIC